MDLKNFFPSVNPELIFSILMEYLPVTLCKDTEDIEDFKCIIYKLLVCEITNLKSDEAKKEYYGNSDINITYTKGIPQGLPQSYFFGNICMIKISEVFNEVFPGKSVYYVDDSYIYTNDDKIESEGFESQLKKINARICEKNSDSIQSHNSTDFFNDKYYYKEFVNALSVDKKILLIS